MADKIFEIHSEKIVNQKSFHPDCGHMIHKRRIRSMYRNDGMMHSTKMSVMSKNLEVKKYKSKTVALRKIEELKKYGHDCFLVIVEEHDTYIDGANRERCSRCNRLYPNHSEACKNN